MRSASAGEVDLAPFDADRSYWMAARVPKDVRRRTQIVFDVLSHVPLQQPVAVVTAGGTTVAVNVALIELLGGAPEDYLDRDWASVMPAWPRRAGLCRPGSPVFEENINRARGGPLWVRVSPGCVSRQGSAEAQGFVLFISIPDVAKVDQAEVRRLRKGVDLLAGGQTAYVVEVDRVGVMTFVSPSFCQAVGAPEWELVGRPFVSRVRADDRAAAEEALEAARSAPFCGEMTARLAADRDADVVWQLEAVVGDGVNALDLVGHVERGAK